MDYSKNKCSHMTYLIRIVVEIVVADEACDKLTVQEVVSVVDGTNTPIGIVVRVWTEAERTH